MKKAVSEVIAALLVMSATVAGFGLYYRYYMETILAGRVLLKALPTPPTSSKQNPLPQIRDHKTRVLVTPTRKRLLTKGI